MTWPIDCPSTMDIVKSVEGFKKVDNTFKFSYVRLIIRENGQLYTAKCPYRGPKREDLYDVELLHTEDRGPKVKSSWTVVESPHNYYVKMPDLWSYTASSGLEERIQREVEICELLKGHPHRNIAMYQGCDVTRGRVSGICFKSYTSTLAEKLNPGHLCKAEFLSRGDLRADAATKQCLDGILAGIHHLHSLGIVHNDITPSNIMFEDDGTPVIIDFDSCQEIGESLNQTKTTHGWHDSEVQTALEKNDLDAFKALKNWLIGSSAEEFIFKAG
jgi:serine/threonine protein kinase